MTRRAVIHDKSIIYPLMWSHPHVIKEPFLNNNYRNKTSLGENKSLITNTVVVLIIKITNLSAPILYLGKTVILGIT